MREKEFEKKLLLTQREYEALAELFSAKKAYTYTQVNYYYDTPDCDFSGKDVTIRIRSKDGYFIKTKKTHCGEFNMEEYVSIDKLPHGFVQDGRNVFLKGKLTTFRSEIFIREGLCLVLDRNDYLGLTDYELELEYGDSDELVAEGIMIFVCWLLRNTNSENVPISKGRRFFERYLNINKKEIQNGI